MLTDMRKQNLPTLNMKHTVTPTFRITYFKAWFRSYTSFSLMDSESMFICALCLIRCLLRSETQTALVDRLAKVCQGCFSTDAFLKEAVTPGHPPEGVQSPTDGVIPLLGRFGPTRMELMFINTPLAHVASTEQQSWAAARRNA